MENNIYYYAPGGHIGRQQVNSNIRGVRISRGVSAFKDGITSRDNIGIFNTLIAKPSPEPVLVDGNQSGAIAYTIAPSCPPFWKPGSQYLMATGAMFRTSAEAAAGSSSNSKNTKNE